MIPAVRRPNILFIVSDDQAPFSTTSETMPFLASEPGGHWVSFDRASLTTPLCHPSRVSLFTGQRSDHHWRSLNTGSAPPAGAEIDTLGPWLKAAGYRTGLAGKYLNSYPYGNPYCPPGWDYWRGTGGEESDAYYSSTVYDENVQEVVAPAGQYLTDELAGYGVDFINSCSPTQPWFFYWASTGPHAPFEVPARHQNLPIADETPANFNEADVSDKPTYVQNLSLLTDSQVATVQQQRKDCKRMLRSIDEAVQAMMNAVEAKGMLDNTIVIYITDNGFPFGEHRRSNLIAATVLPKGVPYRWCIDPQLRIRYPGARARVDHSTVTSVDLTATCVSAAGATSTRTPDGASLERILCEQPVTWRPNGVEGYYLGSGAVPRWMSLLTTAGKKLVRYPTTGEYELYDWVNDPDEINNVASSNSSTVSAMDAQLTALMSNSLNWLPSGGVAPDYDTRRRRQVTGSLISRRVNSAGNPTSVIRRFA